MFDTTARDWQAVLDFVPLHFPYKYLEDGVEVAPIPDYSIIRDRRLLATLLLSVDDDGMKINTHFFRTETIQFDILPREVDRPEKADKIVGFMRSLSSLLRKDVFLNEEHGSASDEWLRERALGWIEAASGRFVSNSN